jgi:hypothetical protein
VVPASDDFRPGVLLTDFACEQGTDRGRLGKAIARAENETAVIDMGEDFPGPSS